mmetsp:Transcript_89647/g.109728  ORF Transcript_89647/g.109728 Transcript_89647/m.109728 type:complete len:278 (+) Transcript_89647:3-836(+)
MADLDAEELQQQLAQAEEEYQEIHQQLAHSQFDLQEARRCGGLLLSAAEAALAPLMLELARAREATDLLLPPVLAKDEVKETSTSAPSLSSREAIEAEIQHLKADIDHFKTVAARLQTEDTQRYYILNSLRNELTEATEELGYQCDRARHHEVCRQLGLPGSAWVGLGPPGIGKRTLQVRAEKRLRESAEERSARLMREVAGLAGDTAEHQATIESLSRRLDKVRSLIKEKETRLSSAAQQTTQLQARLKGIGCSQDKMFKSRKHVASTGKLPQLSF